MTFDVAFIPPEISTAKDAIYVVIDVLRASSTISYLFDMGCKDLLLTNHIDAYIATQKHDTANLVVCAENVAGYCLKGADFSPSLFDLSEEKNLKGKTVLMQTTNGTVAVHTLAQKGYNNILVGCMRNASAVMKCAVDLAEQLKLEIHIVCAGRDSGTSYTIDDVYCAAFLTMRGLEIAQARGIKTKLNDSARLALMTHVLYSSAAQAFSDSASGNIMRSIDRPEDIELCAMIDVSTSVSQFSGYTGEGYLHFKAYKK